MFSRDELAILTRTYAAHTGFEVSTVSTWATGNAKSLQRLIDGHGMSMKSIERATTWFYEHWPEDLAWPDRVRWPGTVGVGLIR